MTSSKEWYRKHPEKRKEHSRRSYLRHKEERRPKQHKNYMKHRTEVILRQQQRWKNPRVRERHNLLRRQRYALNPLPRQIAERSRDARLRGSEGNITLEEWNQLLLQHGFRCAYCGITTARLTMEHIVPVSKGGTNTKGNIVPACQSCNSRKGTKTIFLSEIFNSIEEFVMRGESGELRVPLPKPLLLRVEVV